MNRQLYSAERWREIPTVRHLGNEDLTPEEIEKGDKWETKILKKIKDKKEKRD